MKKLSFLIGATLTALLLSTVGCTGLASSIKAASKDNAFLYGEVKTLYGSGFFVRDGRANSGTTVSDTGSAASILGTNNNLVPSPPRQQQITPEQFAALVRQQADALLAKEKAEQATNGSAKVARPRPPRQSRTPVSQTNTNKTNLP